MDQQTQRDSVVALDCFPRELSFKVAAGTGAREEDKGQKERAGVDRRQSPWREGVGK